MNDYQQGVLDCNSIFTLHGREVIKEIAKCKTAGKPDYVKGKIEQAKRILSKS